MDEQIAGICPAFTRARSRRHLFAVCSCLALLRAGSAAAEELEPEPLKRVATLPAKPDPHWLSVYDMAAQTGTARSDDRRTGR